MEDERVTSTRPVIGITCYVEPASRGQWVDVPSALLPLAYIRKVEDAGGLAVLVPPRTDVDHDTAIAAEILERLDGLILAGGADIDPQRYAADPHPEVQEARADRDGMELALAIGAARTGVPLLGICRGMQVMAVAAGGVLEQHVPDRVGHVDHSPGIAVYGEHLIHTVVGTRLATLLGPMASVPSYHHQSVRTHPGFEPAAWAPDGTLEAMEDAASDFRVGVQWHPEVGHDPRLFDALVRAASQRD
jgi:putative glutamine amidotransferase